MIKNRVLVVGSTTIDAIVQDQSSACKLGGVTTYAGITFTRHEIDTAIISNVAPQDAAILQRLRAERLRVYAGDSIHTTHFVHYNNGDDRRQELPLMADAIQYEQIASLMDAGSLIHLGPLYPSDIAVDALQQLHDPELFISLDLQGFVRQRRHRVVHPVVSEHLPDALRIAKIVKAAEEELQLILAAYQVSVLQLMRDYQIQELVMTSGSQGGTIHTLHGEEILYMPQPVTHPVDTTGAGDVFFATYLLHRFFHSRPIADAAHVAASVAATHIAGKFIAPHRLLLPPSAFDLHAPVVSGQASGRSSQHVLPTVH